MALETSRDRIVALVVAAIVLLVGRVAAHQVGASPRVERGFYILALGCLLAAVFVIVDERR